MPRRAGVRGAALGSVLGSALCVAMAAGAAQAADPDGILTIEPTESGFRITGEVHASEQALVTATLSVEKRDAAGNVLSRQSREVALLAGQREQVAETTVSLGPSGTLEATLSVTIGDRLVSEVHQTVRRNPPDQPLD